MPLIKTKYVEQVSLNGELFLWLLILKLLNFIEGPLLQEIVSNMELHSNISHQNTTRKMYLYAGHDVSIGMTMGFLNNYVSTPGFGGSIHFHLYLSEKNEYTIKVIPKF